MSVEKNVQKKRGGTGDCVELLLVGWHWRTISTGLRCTGRNKRGAAIIPRWWRGCNKKSKNLQVASTKSLELHAT